MVSPVGNPILRSSVLITQSVILCRYDMRLLVILMFILPFGRVFGMFSTFSGSCNQFSLGTRAFVKPPWVLPAVGTSVLVSWDRVKLPNTYLLWQCRT